MPTPPVKEASKRLLGVGGVGVHRVGINRRVGVSIHRHVGVDRIHVDVHGGVIGQDLVGGHGIVNVHGVVGGFVLAASRNRQGRTSDQDKCTHSKLPNYLRSGSRVPRHKSRAQ